MKRGWRWRVVAVVLAVVAMAVASQFLPLVAWIEWLITGLEGKGAVGMVLFTLVYVVAMVACVWGTPFTVAAGMAFGVGWGTVVATVSATGGSALAFLIARHLARDWIARWAAGNPKYEAIDAALGKHGWKVVFLTRFSPIIPFSISNYLFGLTKVGFWPFVWASLGAILPGSFAVAYLGHVGRLTLFDGWSDHGPFEYVVMIGAVVFTGGIVIYFMRLARKELAEINARIETRSAGDIAAREPDVAGPAHAVKRMASLREPAREVKPSRLRF
jgi:uncharacterized membrane protein YdjX (TVP38/TMEM64 family)